MALFRLGVCAAALTTAAVAAQTTPADPRPIVAERVQRITRTSAWKPAAAIPIGFRTFHPQGMVKIGDTFFVSSVEVTVPTRPFTPPQGGYDRDAGAGVGHLFKIDATGKQLADLRLGEGAMYHPGGLDYDGEFLWVPVAEYRPDSRSIVYRIDPRTMAVAETVRVADHIGAIVHNTDAHTLHGLSWGSRRFYRWTLDARGRVTNGDAPLSVLRTLNPAHYIDYQDCKYVGGGRMLCTGLSEIRQTPQAVPFRLGGMDLIDLRDGRPLHQVPVPIWTAGGLDMTHNPVWIEPAGMGLRAYFMPEDDASTIYVFEVS